MELDSVLGVFMSVCLVVGVGGQATITTPPENVAQYVGDNVDLVCEFQESVYELVWYECITTPACSALFRDSVVVGGASPPPRYSVVHSTESSGKRYDLVIIGVQEADGGQFKCDSSATSAPAYAEVIVLGSDLKCSNNLTSWSEVELGDSIYLSSDITFHGRWPPVVRFRYPDNTVLTGLVDETSGVTAKYSVVLEAVKGLQGQTLSAEWYFDDVTGTAAGEATNTPTFPAPNTCSFQPITVFYPPEGLSIDPKKESYNVGETITCTAQGYPAPGIQWINMNDSSVTVNCSTGGPCQLVVSADLLGTTATYRCQPCNNYFSQDRCISEDITFITYTTTTLSTTLPETSATDSLYPDRGPLAGGTVITLLGNGLQSPYPVTAVNIGDDYLATVQFCNDTYLEAITSVGMETDVNRRLRIRLVFQDQRIISVDDHVTFTYRSNPTIRDINPLLTVLEGGTFLTVSGSSLDSVWKPYLEVTTNIRRFLTAGQNSDFNVTNIQSSEICELVNISSETSLLCPTPPSDIPDDILATTGKSSRNDADSAIVTYDTDLAVVTLYIGFKFDGYKAYTNISNVTDEALAAKGVLEIVVTPYFNVTLEAEHSERTPLHIPGYFVDVIDVSNYVVEVGEGGCQRVEISSRLLICFPPSPNDQGAPSGRDVTHAIKVRPGRRLVYAVGSMTYRSNRQLIIGLSIGGALLVLLAITIIAVVFGLRMRTSRRQDDKMAPLRNPDAEIHLGPLPVTST